MINMKKQLLLALLLLSVGVDAGTLACNGTVDTVSYHSNNKLMVKLSSMNTPVFFCSPSEDWIVSGAGDRTMHPETCKTVFSIFLSAKMSEKNITKVHFDGDNVPESCTEFVSWKDVFIRYVKF